MRPVNPIAYAIPFFFALIGVEVWVAKRRKREVYRLPDALSDLGCGVLQQTLGVFTRVFLLAGYALVYDQFHLLEISTSSVLGWVVIFFAVDHQYYWFHRASHQVNFLWAAHVVHHQSEDYNLAVALRQSAIQPLFSFWFYLPLALVGFPPTMFFVTVALNTLYQFWIHTELVGSLGPLEKLINTPSHHRVHHGRNPRYIDRNHAGMLIIWDKMFGTFEPEGEKLIYGITRPARSWSPVWVNFHAWRDLIGLARKTPRLSEKLAVPFMKPGWHPASAPQHDEGYYARLEDPKFDPWAPASYRLYALFQFVLATGVAIALLGRTREGIDARDVAGGVFVTATMIVVGGLLEGRRWIVLAETARLIVTLAVVLEVIRRALVPTPAAVALLGVFVASAIGFMMALRARSEMPGIAARDGALP